MDSIDSMSENLFDLSLYKIVSHFIGLGFLSGVEKLNGFIGVSAVYAGHIVQHTRFLILCNGGTEGCQAAGAFELVVASRVWTRSHPPRLSPSSYPADGVKHGTQLAFHRHARRLIAVVT